MSHKRKEYHPKGRYNYSTVRVGDCLYMWGGYQTDLTYEHDSEKKRAITSVVEVCHLPTGKWEQKRTTGKPPLGVWGYASAVIGNEIYFFGGACNHDNCHHNSLHSLNVPTLEWKEHFSTSSHHGPMMKRGASMVALQLNGEDYLAVMGGCGPLSNNPLGAHNVKEEHFNEIHYYCPKTGEWLSPTINGGTLPPVSFFTLTSLTSDSAVLFGGETPDGSSNDIYFVNFKKASVDITEIPKSVQWPIARDCHSSILINNSSSEPHLLVMGGKNSGDCCSDCWLLDIRKKIWNQLDLPEDVTERYHHSLSVWNVSPSINWIIMNGGRRDWSIVQGTTIIELRHKNSKKWSICTVPSEQYQDKLEMARKVQELKNSNIEKWIGEGSIELKVTRVQMLGPPGSGKTCSQHLLLNEDPPLSKPVLPSDSAPSKSVTNSTPIACKAVKSTRISSNGGKALKRISRDELLEKLASSLNDEAEKQNRKNSAQTQQLAGASAGKSKQELGASATKKNEGNLGKQESRASAGNRDKGKQEQAASAISKNLNPFPVLPSQIKEEVKTSGVLDEIIELIPVAKAQLTDEWVYIIDSGGQPAFQELLPLFTRAASLNVITLDISKCLDEECDYRYRINGQSFHCDQKLKYTNHKHFKSTILSGTIGQKLNLPCVIEHPEHSMYFVLGTHYDEFERAHPDEVEISLAEMNEKLMSSLPLHVINKYIIHNVPQESIIFPVNALLPANSEDRKEASKSLSKAISKRPEVSLKLQVPIRWFVFELQLEERAESKGLSFVTKEEAIAEGKRLLMNEDAVEEALQYLHNCTIILYYPEVRPQLVFVSPQIILDVLSHLLALTYVDDQEALSLVPTMEQKERHALISGKFKEGFLKKFTVFSGEFQPGYFINLLEHLHIIAELRHDTYFLPCALPAHDTCSFQIPKTTIKPLRLVWRIKEDEWESKVIVPVPRGSFHLAIVHLLKIKKSTVICFNNSKGVKQFRDVVSLLISVTKDCEPNDNLYIINCNEYIEVCYTGSEEHCPKVHELVKTAIAESVSALSASCGDLHSAFACQRDNTLCCFVNEDDDGTLKSTFCDGHKCALDNTYLCWFKMSIAKENKNTGLFNPDAAYKAITACTGILKKGLNLDSLVEKLFEKRIISIDEKREVLDKYSGLSTDQRMDKVLNLLKQSIEGDGNDFGLFLEIIKEEDTKRADRLIKKLLDTYNELNA